MNIAKIFNNNAVASVSDDGRDVILTGSGIGFRKRVGDAVDEGRIEKRYYYQNGEADAVYSLFARTPLEYFGISQAIMEEAERRLHVALKDQMLIALTDHIVFAVERAEEGVEFPNLIFSEVKALYRNEYEVGLWGIDLIERELGIRLCDDEAGFIALHILNGSSDYGASYTLDTLQLVSGCVQLIEEELGIRLNKEGLDYLRLVTHLKFLAQRVFGHQFDEEAFHDDEMFDLVRGRNPQIYRCACNVREYVAREYRYTLSNDEVLYLMIHMLKAIH